ncbi:hypothetical protein ACOSQ3_009946 [Xanthoceras sorbifolium]
MGKKLVGSRDRGRSREKFHQEILDSMVPKTQPQHQGGLDLGKEADDEPQKINVDQANFEDVASKLCEAMVVAME